jgi:hypothetical protein
MREHGRMGARDEADLRPPVALDLAAALLAGCLNAGKAVRTVAPSAGTASGRVPESTVGTSHSDGDLAQANDADTVLEVRYVVHGDYERAVIDSSTSVPARSPPAPCPSGP